MDSVLRIGDRVYLMHRGISTLVQGVMKYETPIEFNCGERTIRMAWMDATMDGKLIPRAYGRTFSRYTPTTFMPTRGSLSGESFLDWACQLPVRPEHLVNARRGSNGTLIQIDTNSLSQTGSTVSLWTRYDYPEITFDPPYEAPYDSKREFVRVNCKAKTYRITVGYDFTPEGAVTDGMIEQSETETPFDSTDDYAIAINDVACGKTINPESYTGIGGDPLRAKAPLPGDLEIDDVANPPTVLATAAKLTAVIPAGLTVSSAKITVTHKKLSDPTKDTQTVYVIEPKKDGSTRVREIYSPTFTVDREMIGIVQLKSKLRASFANTRGIHVTQVLTLDAPGWTPGTHLSYRSEMRTTPSSEKPSMFGQDCTIGKPIEASQVHPALSGRAWSMECQTQDATQEKGYYVEELRYVLPTHSESKKYGVSDYTIDSVLIQR
ncbi:hypothetical protein LBW59_13615 [Ralstonia solanacearum]|uniref:Surface-adhesin protein E-like domain-containing protein n=1 Tax=Ralstonia solanacearum TaxID=305 RepID=A0AAW5ZQR6_RALSL|nr:surface-adhesin E family protein [Ralstonia solanacearum]MDB0571802.1 hypothetical protein [Ralstonia solanacearum]